MRIQSSEQVPTRRAWYALIGNLLPESLFGQIAGIIPAFFLGTMLKMDPKLLELLMTEGTAGESVSRRLSIVEGEGQSSGGGRTGSCKNQIATDLELSQNYLCHYCSGVN